MLQSNGTSEGNASRGNNPVNSNINGHLGAISEGGYVLPPEWKAQLDINTQRYYYWNVRTQETRWDPPPHAITPQPQPVRNRNNLQVDAMAMANSSSKASPVPSPVLSPAPVNSIRGGGNTFAFPDDSLNRSMYPGNEPLDLGSQTATGNGAVINREHISNAQQQYGSIKKHLGGGMPPITHCDSPQIKLTKRPLNKEGQTKGLTAGQQQQQKQQQQQHKYNPVGTGAVDVSEKRSTHVDKLRNHQRTLSNGVPIISWPDTDVRSQNVTAAPPSPVKGRGGAGVLLTGRRGHSMSIAATATLSSFGPSGGRHSRSPSGAVTSPLSSSGKKTPKGFGTGNAGAKRSHSRTNSRSSSTENNSPTNVSDSLSSVFEMNGAFTPTAKDAGRRHSTPSSPLTPAVEGRAEDGTASGNTHGLPATSLFVQSNASWVPDIMASAADISLCAEGGRNTDTGNRHMSGEHQVREHQAPMNRVQTDSNNSSNNNSASTTPTSSASIQVNSSVTSLGSNYDRSIRLTRSFSNNRKRRENVTAESMDYAATSNYERKCYPKSEADQRALDAILSDHFLFQQMSAEDRSDVLDAMQELKCKKEHVLIKEGDQGDFFYVIKAGQFEVQVAGKVALQMEKGCFGELALLYNCPRAATIVCTMDSSVWALDRASFRQTIQASTQHHLGEAKAALKSIPLLKVLTEDQIDLIKGLVRFVDVNKGDEIINKGEVGNVFYIIRSGRVLCSGGEAVDQDGNTTVELSDHDYFGERALLTDEPRAANVVATTDVKLMALDRHAFNIILGPLREILDYNIRATVLQHVPLFQSLTPQEREQAIKAFSTVRIEAGKFIIRQGEEGTTFYVIRHGQACVTQETTLPGGVKTTTQLNELSTGDYFGEMAMTDGGARQANVIAQTECECFVLEREQFKSLLQSAREILDQKAEERRKENAEKTHKLTKSLSPDSVDMRASRHHRSSSLEKNLREHQTDVNLFDLQHIRTLGTGTFGRVRLVFHEATKRTFALKIQSKSQIVKYKLKTNVLNEKNVLQQLNDPFIIKLHQTFVDRDCLYMLLELVPGGELFSLLQIHGHRLSTDQQVFYTACVLSACQAMHKCDILYRDLKPENLLIDHQGYLKLCDFGFAKVVKHNTFTLCGTPEYFSPELVLGKGYSKGNDYWALGILVYEIINGYTPFGVPEADQTEICRRIIKEKLLFPTDCDDELGMDLMARLLEKDWMNRLGCGKNGAEDIKCHPWFHALDFGLLAQKQYKAPWVPELRDQLDGSHFDKYDERYNPGLYRDDGTGWDIDF